MTTVTWHQPRLPTYDDPEYYAPGPMATFVGANGRTVIITNCGRRHLDHTALRDALRTPEQFRSAFPGGTLPADGSNGWAWENNGWFSVCDEAGEPIDEDVSYSLMEAVAFANELLVVTPPPETSRRPGKGPSLFDRLLRRHG